MQEENFWTDSAIIRIIRDEQYLGKAVYGKRYYDVIGKSHSVKVSKKDWIIMEQVHDSIITQKEFDRAQAALREYVERGSFQGKQLLRKRVCCGVCGHAMVRKEAKASYVCRTASMAGTQICPGTRILEQDLFAVVLDGLHAQADIALDVSAVWEAQHRQDKKDIQSMLKQLNSLGDALDQVKLQSYDLYEFFVLGKMEKEEYTPQRAALKRTADSISDRIASLREDTERSNPVAGTQNRFVDVFRQYAEVQELTDKIVADVLTKIHVYPDYTVEIVWNHQDDLRKLISGGKLEEIERGR